MARPKQTIQTLNKSTKLVYETIMKHYLLTGMLPSNTRIAESVGITRQSAHSCVNVLRRLGLLGKFNHAPTTPKPNENIRAKINERIECSDRNYWGET